MEKLTTIHIYFEYEAKVKSKLFWKVSIKQSLSSKILELAKKHNIRHCHYFNVTKGYLNHNDIQWHNTEIVSSTHPQRIELTDTDEKISGFIEACNQLKKDCSAKMHILGTNLNQSNSILEIR